VSEIRDMRKRDLITVLEQSGRTPDKRTSKRELVREVTRLAHTEPAARERFIQSVMAMTSAQLMDTLIATANSGNQRYERLVRDEMVARMAI
jgi:hypothetical protein